MTWVRLDEEFSHHPKVLQAGPLGIAMQVSALCYCNRYLTDGFIPNAVAPTLLDLRGLGMCLWSNDVGFGGGEDATWDRVVGDLLAAGLWEEVEGGYRIHDYHDYQPSKAEVLELREKRKEAGQKGGLAKAKASAKAVGKRAPSKEESKRSSKSEAKSYPVSGPVPVPDSVPQGDLKTSPKTALANNIAYACEQRDFGEALQVVELLAPYVDDKLIEEAVGWTTHEDTEHPPTPLRPRYFLTVVADWAQQRGIEIPAAVVNHFRKATA